MSRLVRFLRISQLSNSELLANALGFEAVLIILIYCVLRALDPGTVVSTESSAGSYSIGGMNSVTVIRRPSSNTTEGRFISGIASLPPPLESESTVLSGGVSLQPTLMHRIPMDIPDRKRILITVCNGDVIFFDLTYRPSTAGREARIQIETLPAVG